MSKKQSCRTCAYLQGEKFRKGKVYPCGWMPPELPIADSIKWRHSWLSCDGERYFMEPDDGEWCATWKPREVQP
jgi:hypothetical protein